MSYQTLLLIATLFAVGAFVVMVTRLGHPHHRRLALAIYGIGWIPFVLSIRQAWLAHDELIEQVMPWKLHLAIGLGFLALAWIFLTLFPTKPSDLQDADPKSLAERIDADRKQWILIDDTIQRAAAALANHPLLGQDHLTTAQAHELRELWAQVIESSYELDLLRREYRSFFHVNTFTRPQLHAKAFFVAYASFVSQYRAASVILSAISGHEGAKRVLDDSCQHRGIPENSLSQIQALVSHPEEILRLNAGRAYLQLMKRRLRSESEEVDRTRGQLSEITRLALLQTETYVAAPLDLLEKHASKVWFPLQRGVALGMASVRTTSRPYFITEERLSQEKHLLQPGDILLTRREWHMTNLGIPGYWTHAALHVGSPAQLDDFFEGMELLEGRRPSDIMNGRRPRNSEALFRDTADARHEQMVIEALRPGVIIQPLMKSATADSLGVLRPNITREDRWRALLAALPHLGKPYNYQFDFRTDSALLCSQLVCKAYEETSGIEFLPRMNSGRLLFSPNEIAIKFDQEFDQSERQLELVLFLDGISEGNAVIRSDEDFRSSWSRPKWHILFERESD